MRAAESRAVARAALKNNWGMGIGVNFLYLVIIWFAAGIISAIFGAIFGLSMLDYIMDAARYGSRYYYYYGPSAGQVVLMYLSLFATSAVLSAVQGALSLGLNQIHIDLVKKDRPATMETLFAYFRHWLNAFLLQLLISVFTALWSMLFVIPGIIAHYRYAMAPYLMAQNPNLAPLDAIRMSKEMMQGHKSRLFCMQLSFIGWTFLIPFTLGLGAFVLVPYINAAQAAFYLDLTGQINKDYILANGYNTGFASPGYQPPGGPYPPQSPYPPQGPYQAQQPYGQHPYTQQPGAGTPYPPQAPYAPSPAPYPGQPQAWPGQPPAPGYPAPQAPGQQPPAYPAPQAPGQQPPPYSAPQAPGQQPPPYSAPQAPGQQPPPYSAPQAPTQQPPAWPTPQPPAPPPAEASPPAEAPAAAPTAPAAPSVPPAEPQAFTPPPGSPYSPGPATPDSGSDAPSTEE